MINQDKWIDSLPIKNANVNENASRADHDKWLNTIPKKNSCGSVKKYSAGSVKKYSAIIILFLCGLLFVSAVKNETRNLEKEINNLKASKNIIKFNLEQAILDHVVITSPENISRLVNKYLNIDLVSYKKSQIRQLGDETVLLTKVDKIKKEKKNKKTIKNLSTDIKSKVAKKIDKKKIEIKKLQELYSNPQSIPDEIKNQVAIKIQEKKVELKNIYNAPKNIFTLKRAGKWTVIQVVKVFLGIPVVPGR